MSTALPKVTIGLPVYNGENFLREAIAAILAQTFTDFELIISDNASTDSTEAICREFAERDRRIRYHRNPENIGASPNFNLVFQLARGEYFKWAAHDDLIAPEFLAQCVAVLDANPDVVLCQTRAKIIGQDGQFLNQGLGTNDELYIKFTNDIPLPTDSQSVAKRFQALACFPHSCHHIFGLIRTSALGQTPLIEGYAGSDKVLLAQLGLLGRFHDVPQSLFFLRRHLGQSINIHARSTHLYSVWYDPANRGKLIFPRWQRFGKFLAVIRTAPLGWRDRMACYFQIGSLLKAEGAGMVKDVAIALIQILDNLYCRLRNSPATDPATPEPLIFNKIPRWSRINVN